MKEELNNSNLENKDEIIKLKREKLKPIQVRRSIKDILIDKNPCDYIYNYTGKNISVFEEELLKNNNNIKEAFGEIKNNKNNLEGEVINSISIDDHEKRLLEELNELLNKKDLSSEIKNNIKSLFIEVQEFYLEIKNDLKTNYPSTKDLLKLYSTNDCSDKNKNIIWRSFCFYKLLSDQLNDLHISTISSYRLQCLRTIYKWYNKNKRILFNYQSNKKKINFLDEKIITNNTLNENSDDICYSIKEEKTTLQRNSNDLIGNHENNKEKKEDIKENKIINQEEDIKNNEENDNKIKESDSIITNEYKRELSEDFGKSLKEHIHVINEKNEENKDIELHKKNEVTDNESNEILHNYLFPNYTLINTVEQEQKEENNLKNNMNIEKNEEKREENNEHNKKEEKENEYEKGEYTNLEKLKSDKYDFNSTLLEDGKDDFFHIPIDTKKIKELEEEIKKQKLLIKKKEIEIINSPIGIKFKDIFGNFQDIDINN
ncbi:conserved Plasmodium protein, unknown function [Plasmodium relictum]|uniref:Uncharacterized protein n=1 Tax=Plasmodium relictum TaxID=85471 RepID=A0A1J1H516_PLARL|nr:conserved Plasmodium protein, unknown function [Plasmodium relictum]CRG98681.1 conserved Plasmodium protein, unknown function [Plasmodium relictum]